MACTENPVELIYTLTKQPEGKWTRYPWIAMKDHCRQIHASSDCTQVIHHFLLTISYGIDVFDIRSTSDQEGHQLGKTTITCHRKNAGTLCEKHTAVSYSVDAQEIIKMTGTETFNGTSQMVSGCVPPSMHFFTSLISFASTAFLSLCCRTSGATRSDAIPEQPKCTHARRLPCQHNIWVKI